MLLWVLGKRSLFLLEGLQINVATNQHIPNWVLGCLVVIHTYNNKTCTVLVFSTSGFAICFLDFNVDLVLWGMFVPTKSHNMV